MTYNGIRVSRTNDYTRLEQRDKIESYKNKSGRRGFQGNAPCANRLEQISDRRSAHPADVCATIHLIAPGNDPTTKTEIKMLANVIKHLK